MWERSLLVWAVVGLSSSLSTGCRRPQAPGKPFVASAAKMANDGGTSIAPRERGAVVPAPEANAPTGSTTAVAPATRTAALPAPLAAGFPGWLGFAARRPGLSLKRDWTPHHPKAAAVVFSDRWRGVRPGTPLVALFPGGRRPVTYLGTSRIRYGCEENTATVAGFAAAAPIPEGPVWLLPPASAGTARVRGLGSAKIRGGREWRLDDVTLRLSRTGPLKAALTVRRKARAIFTHRLTKGDMGGAPRDPIQISSDDEVGVAVPMSALRLRPGGPWFVPLLVPRYEGTGFPVVRVGSRAARLVAQPYLYRCAF